MTICRAADVLLGGGIIAYPTEGVFGLGCMPDDANAVSRLLQIKRRDPRKGLILIAAHKSQFDDWLDPDGAMLPELNPLQPITWLAAAKPLVMALIRGDHSNVAVRLTSNPVAAQICMAVDSPIVSTSANIAGQPVARNRLVLRRRFQACVDYIVPGNCGPTSGPSEIRDLASGNLIRPGTA
ncbi:MAG: Sua5/YciO/YrdC/YwlC family protein [Gammaproteobacteria bacterium]|nr:Sua5/YciO/YrdC/YwlC family protein [Gammaproteobacteria bacterium]